MIESVYDRSKRGIVVSARKTIIAPVLKKSDGPVIFSRRGEGVSRFRRIPSGREARSLCPFLKQSSDRLDNKVDGLKQKCLENKANTHFDFQKNGGIRLCVELLDISEKMTRRKFY